jgi:hypothetical protein
MMKETKMLKYVAIFSGLMIMCVPEDASFLRFAVQAIFGLGIFMIGVGALIESAE